MICLRLAVSGPVFRAIGPFSPVLCRARRSDTDIYAAMALIMAGMPMIAITRLKL